MCCPATSACHVATSPGVLWRSMGAGGLQRHVAGLLCHMVELVGDPSSETCLRPAAAGLRPSFRTPRRAAARWGPGCRQEGVVGWGGRWTSPTGHAAPSMQRETVAQP